jgi:hypothetical protein
MLYTSFMRTIGPGMVWTYAQAIADPAGRDLGRIGMAEATGFLIRAGPARYASGVRVRDGLSPPARCGRRPCARRPAESQWPS